MAADPLPLLAPACESLDELPELDPAPAPLPLPLPPLPPAPPLPPCANAILAVSTKAIRSFLFMCCSFEVSLPVGLICLPHTTARRINADVCLESSKQFRVGLLSHRMQSCCSC